MAVVGVRKPRLIRHAGGWWCGLGHVDCHAATAATPKEAWMTWALARKGAGLMPWG